MQETSGYNLELYEGTDKTAWLGAFNGNMRKIDNALTEQYASVANTNADTHADLLTMRNEHNNFKKEQEIRQAGFELNMDQKFREYRDYNDARTQTAIEIGQGNTSEIARIKKEDIADLQSGISDTNIKLNAAKLTIQDEISGINTHLTNTDKQLSVVKSKAEYANDYVFSNINGQRCVYRAYPISTSQYINGGILTLGDVAIGTLVGTVSDSPSYVPMVQGTRETYMHKCYINGNPFGLTEIAVTDWMQIKPDYPNTFRGDIITIGGCVHVGGNITEGLLLCACYEISHDRTYLMTNITNKTINMPDSGVTPCVMSVLYNLKSKKYYDV